MSRYHYKAYGLSIFSELHCPEFQVHKNGTPEVEIRYGRAPEHLEAPIIRQAAYQAEPGAFLLTIKGITRFLVSQGRHIVINDGEDRTADVRSMLYGSPFVALLNQRGSLVLHGSAIETPQGAVIFAGQSGSGKSTLAGAFVQRGYRILTDDVCAIKIDGQGTPVVQPGYPALKVWADSAQSLGLPVEGARKVRESLEKYYTPLGDRFAPESMPVHAIYVLIPHNRPDVELTTVEPSDRLQILVDNTYQYPFVEGLAVQAQHFRIAAAVGGRARFARLKRPITNLITPDTLADVVHEDFR